MDNTSKFSYNLGMERVTHRATFAAAVFGDTFEEHKIP